MVTDYRRSGDHRPATHDEKLALTAIPNGGEPFRFLPKHGQPYCWGEWLAQHLIRTLVWWPIYTGIVVTLILVVQIVHPFGLGR